MENCSAILKCFQCLSTFCLYRLFCCLLRNKQNFSWVWKAVSTISQTLLPVLPVYSDCTRRIESRIKTATKSQDLQVPCNCSRLFIFAQCFVRLNLCSWKWKFGWEGSVGEGWGVVPSSRHCLSPSVVYGAVLGYMVQGGLPGRYRARRSGCPPLLCLLLLWHDMPHLGQVLVPLCRASCALQWEGAGSWHMPYWPVLVSRFLR